MRRIAAILTAALLTLLGATPASAAPAPLGGGSTLTSGSSFRCTAAFAARQGSTGHLIAGPGCAVPVGTPMSSGGVLVGPVVAVSTSGVTVVRVTNTAAWQLVPWIRFGDGQHLISGSVEAPVGGSVCLLDSTSGLRCGTITAKNQTVNFPGGVVSGLTRTNICLLPGSSIAFVSGAQAQGVPLGGSGSCGSGGVSFFKPVNPLLSAYGLTLVTG
jgi:streptogrisin C